MPRDLLGDSPPISHRIGKLLASADAVTTSPPGIEDADFLHAILCQLGMPRSRPAGRSFERISGGAMVLLEAGKLAKRGRFVEMPLPFGTRPRLVMVYASTKAIREKTRVIDVGTSMRSFMQSLGIDTGGRECLRFRGQVEALAACRMTLGLSTAARDLTIHTQPIERFEAWLSHGDQQGAMWPGEIELSERFYDTLREFAVPLSRESLTALKGSSLALDTYTWLAYRLWRVKRGAGEKVSWANLHEQFGHEYDDVKNFKKRFIIALRTACAVYAGARVELVPGGVLLRASPSPIPRVWIGWQK